MPKNKALGRGLEDLFGMDKENIKESVTEININDITNYEHQPRKDFKENKLNELAQSIKEKGIIQPIIVSLKGDKYEIIVGERRWRAAKIAGLNKIPCIIKNVSKAERLEIALIENIQREDLNAIEEAETYDEIMKTFNITQEDLAKKIGKSRTSVSNSIRLLKLPQEVKDEIIKGNITEGHAKVLIGLEYNEIIRILSRIKSEQLSVRQVENIVSKRKKPEHEITEIQKKKKDPQQNKEIVKEKIKKNKITLRGGELVEEALSEYESIDENKNESITKNDYDYTYNNSPDDIPDIENLNEFLKIVQLELRKIFKSGVTIHHEPSNKGKIEIPYKSLEHLRHILEYFGYNQY